MDTNSNIPVEKKVVKIIPLDLDKEGYGPEGKHTRQKWRDECLTHLQNNTYAAWIESWRFNVRSLSRTLSFPADESSPKFRNFPYELIYEDGSKLTISDPYLFEHNKYPLDFVGQTFESGAMMGYMEIKVPILFTGAKFNGMSNFSGIKFIDLVDFDYAKFANNTNFNGATFHNYAQFQNTIFSGNTEFIGVNFNALALFNNAIFDGKLNFLSGNFKGAVFFDLIVVKDDAEFSKTVLENECFFRGAIFEKSADFICSEFKNQCHFESVFNEELNLWSKETEFGNEVNFENAIIKMVGHFERVKFKKKIPNFLGVDNANTLLIFSDDKYFNKDDTHGNATDRIAQLKRLAEEQGQTDQMLMFNAFELNAKAKQPNAGWGMKLVTCIYDVFSNFGRSFLRPLGIYVCLLALTFLIALEHSAYSAPRNYTQTGCDKYIWWIERVTWIEDENCLKNINVLKLTGVRAASEYTLYRAAGVLDFSDSDKQTKEVALRLFGQEIEPWWMRIWGVFKAIVSTALLFLVALGLRNKYRIK